MFAVSKLEGEMSYGGSFRGENILAPVGDRYCDERVSCMSASISQEPHVRTSPNLLCMLCNL